MSHGGSEFPTPDPSDHPVGLEPTTAILCRHLPIDRRVQGGISGAPVPAPNGEVVALPSGDRCVRSP